MNKLMTAFLLLGLGVQAYSLTPNPSQQDLGQWLNSSTAMPSMQTESSQNTDGDNAATATSAASASTPASGAQPPKSPYQTAGALVQPGASVGHFATPGAQPVSPLLVKPVIMSSLPPVALPPSQPAANSAPVGSSGGGLVLTPSITSPNPPMNLFKSNQ